jgi:iron complex outermembrane receptor protein
MTPAMRWVGSPGIDPEKHFQWEVGAIASDSFGLASVSFYYNWVDDFILRDRARSQDGVLLSDRATIYRNVEAELFGVESELRLNFTDTVILDNQLAFTYADNTTDDRPVAQIPPLEGRSTLSYEGEPVDVGFTLRWAAEQHRIDDSPATGSGLDAGRTPEYVVCDIYGKIDISKNVSLGIGVENLFDRAYANHLNKSNAFDVDQVQVNEPGTNVWLRVSANL